jgi:hypothetical protein
VFTARYGLGLQISFIVESHKFMTMSSRTFDQLAIPIFLTSRFVTNTQHHSSLILYLYQKDERSLPVNFQSSKIF